MMAAAVAIFADPIIVLFAGTDMEMREIGKLCIWLQCIALPIHAWVMVVNMLCVGLGNAKGAFLLATARQGTCFIPILYPLALLLGSTGVASTQAAADVLSLAMAFPIMAMMNKKIRQVEQTILTAPQE